MGNWIAEKITQKLIASSVIEEGDRELYIYGFFLLTNKILYFFVAVTVGTLASVTFESIIFYIVFMSLRTYAGGIHAKTEMACTVLTTLALTMFVLVIKHLSIHNSEIAPFLMLGVGSLCILLLSPLDSSEKPIDDVERSQYKIICVAILVPYFIVAVVAGIYLVNRLFYPVVCGIYLESILLVAGKICNHREQKYEPA